MTNPTTVPQALSERVAALESWKESVDRDAGKQMAYLVRIEDRLVSLERWMLGTLAASLVGVFSILLTKALR